MKRPEGIIWTSLFFFIVGALFLLGSLVVTAVAFVSVASEYGTISQPFFWTMFGAAMALLVSLLHLIVGFGIWRIQSWSRYAAIILAALALPCFPIGTLLGILIIFYLVTPATKKLFKTKKTPEPAEPPKPESSAQ